MAWYNVLGTIAGGGLYQGAKYLAGGGNPFSHPGETQQREGLTSTAGASNAFADQGQQQFGVLGGKLGDQYGYLQDVARGGQSVSAEQLRQALGQNIGAQQSMAAGAAPQNQAMAALMASRNAMQLGSGLAGQQALAGIQERQAAQQALMQALLQQRQQELQAATQGRSTAVAGYGGITPGKSTFEQFAGPVMGAAQIYATGGAGGAAPMVGAARAAPTQWAGADAQPKWGNYA